MREPERRDVEEEKNTGKGLKKGGAKRRRKEEGEQTRKLMLQRAYQEGTRKEKRNCGIRAECMEGVGMRINKRIY